MRIVLDGRCIADRFPGIGRYFFQLALALGSSARRHTFLVLYHPRLPNTRHDLGQLAGLPGVELVPAPMRHLSVQEQLQLPLLLRALRAECYHTPYYVYPYAGLPCPSVVMLHDLIPLRFPRESSIQARLLFDLLHRLAIAGATRLVTGSEAARRDLVATYRIAPEQIRVVHHAAGDAFAPQPDAAVAIVRARYNLPARYVLSVGSNKPHKNQARLVEAMALLADDVPDVYLVLAGHTDPRYDQVQVAIAQTGMQQRVIVLPNLAEADIPALYAGAEVFCFPSSYEGFGLPLLEAMASGVPVVCGWHSSMPEVVGSAALLVDVEDAAAISRAIALLLRDRQLQAAFRSAGLERARQFSWQRAAQATLQVYESLLVG